MRAAWLCLILSSFAIHRPVLAQKPTLVYAKDGSGVFGYKDTPVQPWSGFRVHDPDRPIPPRVDPGPAGPSASTPSDAIVLFDGRDLSQFLPSQWKVENGYVEITEGNLVSKREFGDMQLHIEWRTPDPPEGDVMNRGNSGVELMGLFEIQIYESYTEKIYPDGQAASVYGQTPPLVNASRKPGEWQSYDIVFYAPRFENGKLALRPRVTVFHNGILVQHNVEIYGSVAHRTLPPEIPVNKVIGPVKLGGHHCPVRYRNIWVRPLAGAK
jgi:hypothetical protein